jgi:hypothetical protein
MKNDKQKNFCHLVILSTYDIYQSLHQNNNVAYALNVMERKNIFQNI